jgi:hypothetical protein
LRGRGWGAWCDAFGLEYFQIKHTHSHSEEHTCIEYFLIKLAHLGAQVL